MDMRIKDHGDSPDGIDLDGDLDMELDGEDEEDEVEEVMKEEEVADEDEEEDEDEDEANGKESRTIGQGEMVNTLADDAVTLVYDQPTVLPEQGQEMGEHTSRLQPPAPAQRPPTTEPCPQPRTPETHTLSGLKFLGLVSPRRPRRVAPTLREAAAAGNSWDVDMDHQGLIESAGGNSLPDNPLPGNPLPDIPLAEACPDGSTGEEWTSPGMQRRRAFGLGSGSCLESFLCCNLFISGTD